MRVKKSPVVSLHSPYRRWCVFACCLCGLIFTGVMAWFSGHSRANLDNVRLQQLARDNIVLQQEKQHLTDKVSQLVRSMALAKEAQRLLTDDNRKRQDQIYALRKDIAIYKRVLAAPSQMMKKIHVAGLHLKPSADGRHYRFELTIIQTGQKHPWVTGRLSGTLMGVTHDGHEKKLNWQNVVVSKQQAIKFRYYQTMAGELLLPAQFSPKTVELTLKLHNNQIVAQHQFAWSTAEEDALHVQIEGKNNYT